MARGADGTPISSSDPFGSGIPDIPQALLEQQNGTPAIGDPEHQAFMATIVDAFIRALDERQDQQPSPSRSSLARQAYDKMQFDFPLLSVEELEAFDSEIGSTMASGTFPAQYPLSDKMMSALIDGASVTNTSSRTATRDGNNEGDADEREGAVTTGTPEPSRLQVLFQKLCARLLFKGVQQLLELETADAIELLTLVKLPPSLAGAEDPECVEDLTTKTIENLVGRMDPAVMASGDSDWEPLEDEIAASQYMAGLGGEVARNEMEVRRQWAAEAGLSPADVLTAKIRILLASVSFDLVSLPGQCPALWR
ncbi:hypothetical protein CYMTET_31055 [Cymbomonas tetramitiformis]|uniref:Uncharacterized protein n=1 Tax=Cymbomonas tetramitiformis TaxID=36881 RepID=A0AAE0FHL0_9CHLO|nr:hypothetical protein CYMTET_31055 [Cymbomonas tetramitiformis]